MVVVIVVFVGGGGSAIATLFNLNQIIKREISRRQATKTSCLLLVV